MNSSAVAKRCVLSLIVVLALALGFGLVAAAPSFLQTNNNAYDATGTLVGNVHFSGLACRPVDMDSQPCGGPSSNYKVVIYALDGKTEVMQVLTDASGNYSVSLEAGSYVIYVPQFNALDGRMEMVPTTVTILPGQVTRFDIAIYTGIMAPIPEFTPPTPLLILATTILAIGVIGKTLRKGSEPYAPEE
jgi:hypothetical protein